MMGMRMNREILGPGSYWQKPRSDTVSSAPTIHASVFSTLMRDTDVRD